MVGDYSQKPVIVLSCPSSGTTILTKYLEQSGVFMGHLQNGAHEDRRMIYVHGNLLINAGVSWKFPEIVTPTPDLISQYQQAFENMDHKQPWGFKELRSVCFAEIQKEVFDDPLFIHLRRDVKDTANSLYQRYINPEDSLAEHFVPPISDDYSKQDKLESLVGLYHDIGEEYGDITIQYESMTEFGWLDIVCSHFDMPCISDGRKRFLIEQFNF